jgi:predicted lysophospholipase L1 biosynthesis ABC-type transport system permease subunit
MTLFDESLDAIQSIPGVTSAAVTLSLPYERPLNDGFRLAGAEEYAGVDVVYVTPGLFATLGIPLRRGRVIDERDRAGAPVAVVANEAFADTYLRDRPDVGAALDLGAVRGATVVGVVGNVQQPSGLGGNRQPVWESPTLYVSVAQLPASYLSLVHVWFSPSFVLQARSDIAPRVRDALRAVAPDLAVARVTPMQDLVEDAFAWERLQATFLLAAGAFTLLLALVGLYGIIAHEVQERRGELGLRLSLGASPGGAVWATSARGIALTLYGLLAGAVLGVFAARKLLTELLHGVGPLDATTLVVVLASLLLVSVAASLVPAARVARIDPAEVLRAA